MKSFTIKLAPEQLTWLEQQAHNLKRSKGGVIRDLIDEQQSSKERSVGHALRDLCGSVKGSRNLSTRSLKGYGRD